MKKIKLYFLQQYSIFFWLILITVLGLFASKIYSINKNSTIYAPYINESNSANLSYFGSMIELSLRSKIPSSDVSLNYPGIYSETNPLGYYSYRIVVKQQEQDYYNVYVPGTLAGKLLWNVDIESGQTAPTSSSQLPSFVSRNRVSMINLFGDNINKVPKELKISTNANDDTFGSEITLFNRVNPIYNSNVSNYSFRSYNKQSKINRSGQKVVSIEPFKSLGEWTTTKGRLFPAGNENMSNSDPQPWYPYYLVGTQYNFHDIFFNAQSNPFIATIETNFKIGATPDYTVTSPNQKIGIERAWQSLGVYETEPTKSALDIYYESSSTGLISDLNNEVTAAVPAGIKDANGNNTVLNQNIEYIQIESDLNDPSAEDVTLEFQLVDSSGSIININSILELQQINGVVDGLGNDRTSEFEVVSGVSLVNSFKLRCKENQVFLSDSPQRESYTFNLLATDIQNSTPTYANVPIQITNCQLQNAAPIWVNPPSGIYQINEPNVEILSINNGDVVNGSSNTNRNTEQIVLELVNQDSLSIPQPGRGVDDFQLLYNFSLNSYSLIAKPTLTNGSYFIAVKATDANGNGLSTNANIQILSFR